MSKTSRKYRKTALTLFAGVISLLMLGVLFHGFRTFFYRFFSDFFYPYLSVPANLGRTISDQTMLLRSKDELVTEIEKLRRENQLLMSRFTVATEAQIENRELRQLIKLERNPGFRYVYTTVLLRDPLDWRERFIINCGSEDGIRPGSVVLTGSRVTENDTASIPALCGIVREVSRHTAEVITLVGGEAAVSARLESSDAVGFINADTGAAVPGDMRTRLNFLPANREYMAGEPVVTAGFEKDIPAGILIGHITEVLGGNTVYDNRLYVNALVRPAADFENIRFLVVLTRQ